MALLPITQHHHGYVSVRSSSIVRNLTLLSHHSQMAPYFAKVECFCFEQQKIRAGETVDLPVFFFIDRDIIDDVSLTGVNDVVLSYTFFK